MRVYHKPFINWIWGALYGGTGLRGRPGQRYRRRKNSRGCGTTNRSERRGMKETYPAGFWFVIFLGIGLVGVRALFHPP
jgi:hypothetical protein